MTRQKINYIVLRSALALTFFVCNMALFAQPPGGPPPGGGGTTGSTPPCWEPECVPIDAGLGFLVVAGAVFGVRKLYKQH